MAFDGRPEETGEVSQEDIWEKSIPCRVEECSVCSRNNKEARVAGSRWARERQKLKMEPKRF